MNVSQPVENCEKRQQERFSPAEGAYVETPHAGSGLIVDINAHGLAFTYIARKRRPPESFLLDIIQGENTVCEKLPFSKVYDQPIPHCHQDKTLIIRRCGVRFNGLNADQQARIDAFVRSHSGQ